LSGGFYATKYSKMKKIEDLTNTLRGNKSESLLSLNEHKTNTNISRNLRKIVLITGLVCTGIFFNGCMAGYVATEPTYRHADRPPQPGNSYIWIDGDWTYNHQTHSYVEHNGYWRQPSQGRTYVSGHFQSSQKGYHWIKGRSVKQNNQKNHGKR
jgi:hypothetical protein